ncbi:MAG: hypothetical protein AAF731_00855 [Bacteroidota bacterium]
MTKMTSDMDDTKLELFDRYVRNELSHSEVQDFEQQLARDVDLKKAFEDYTLLISGIELSAADDLKSRLRQQEQRYLKQKGPYVVYLKIAASIILVAAVSFLTYNYRTQPNYQDLFVKHYAPYPNVVDPINRAEQSTEISVFQLYENKQYDEVIERLANGSNSDDEQFYFAQSQLAIGNIKKAIDSFKKVSTTSRFYQTTRWYLALCYLSTQNTDLLKSSLESIVDGGGDYSKQASSIRDNI